MHRWAFLTIAGAAALGACVGPAPASPASETCVKLGEDVVQLAWSQTGAFLGVGSVDAEGLPSAWSLRADDPDPEDKAAELEAGMRPETIVVGPSGELAWIAETELGRYLIERGADGRATRLPDGVSAIAWTAIGYALLQHPAGGGSRVLNFDVDRSHEPTVSYETNLFVERLWISADPESMVLTILHPDHRDVPASFQVVGAGVEHHLEPAGADASGASMPSLRRWLVYRSATTSRMEAVRVADPGETVVLSDRPAVRGMISDRGVLAFVPVAAQGSVCLANVSARLP